MEVVAPRGVAAAPFALCPSFQMLAAAPPSDADENGSSRLDLLRLLQPCGSLNLGNVLEVDCFHRAPGLRSLAWSATAAKRDDEFFEPIENDLYPAGLLAGGFDDGSVRIWNPAPALSCELKEIRVPEKLKAVLILDEDHKTAQTEKANISATVAEMYSDISKITWTKSKNEEFSQQKDEELLKAKDEEDMKGWDMVEGHDEIFGWDIVNKEEPVIKYNKTKNMQLMMEAHDLSGPVLGLSFNELYPYWLATAASGDNICVHDLHYPIQLCQEKRELSGIGSKVNSQTTCLKWSKLYPCTMASSGDAGMINLWDVRTSKINTTFKGKQDNCSSDLEFSWNNPMHLAVSSVTNGKSAAVKIWDLRHYWKPFNEYGCGEPGVLSLSWDRSGQLLASHQNGSISCYNPYNKKVQQQMNFGKSDLGLTWTHADNTVATFSSKDGVKLYDIAWFLEGDI